MTAMTIRLHICSDRHLIFKVLCCFSLLHSLGTVPSNQHTSQLLAPVIGI